MQTLLNILDGSVKNIQYTNNPICKRGSFRYLSTPYFLFCFFFSTIAFTFFTLHQSLLLPHLSFLSVFPKQISFRGIYLFQSSFLVSGVCRQFRFVALFNSLIDCHLSLRQTEFVVNLLFD